MKPKKTVLVIVAVVLAVAFLFIAARLLGDDAPPKLPTKSAANSLILTSNGCCFGVMDVKVTLLGGNDNQIELCSLELIRENDIFKYDIPELSGGPLTLYVEFHVHYDREGVFSLPVLEFTDLDALKKTGALLYFQEADGMYLNVIAGEYHASYKMGSEANRWLVMDTPKKVYSD